MRTYQGRTYFETRQDYAIPGFKRHQPDIASVPTTYESYTALKRLGFTNPPHPLDDDSNYPGMKPYAHQKETAKFFVYNKRGWCLNGTGTGKTASALWAVEHLRALGLVSQVLIICPLSTIDEVWVKEINKCYPLRSVASLHGPKEKRLALLKHPYDYFVINHDGIKIKAVARALIAHEHINLIVADEATAFKNPSTIRYKTLKYITDLKARRLWALTATPASHNPTDVWAMSRIINPENTPTAFGRFKTDTMLKVSNFKWVPRRGSTERVNKILQPAIRFKKEECMDLPKFIPTMWRSVEMTKQQQKAFTQVRNEFMYMHESGEVVSAANAAVKLSKLLQICCGGVYTDEKQVVTLENTYREEALLGIIESIENKAIVFVPFKSAQNQIKSFLRAKKISCALVNGDTTLKKRSLIFSKFQNETKLEVLIAHPRVAAHGLTLTAADTIIWYAPVHSLEIYEQGNSRIDRPGQKAKHLSKVHISAHPIERAIYKGLEAKSLTQQKILSFYEKVIKGVDKW